MLLVGIFGECGLIGGFDRKSVGITEGATDGLVVERKEKEEEERKW